MADSYPDVPGFRFEYDRDGSVVVYDLSTGIATATTIEMQKLNNEDGAGGGGGGGAIGDAFTFQTYVAMAWPEPRTIAGLYGAVAGYGLSDTLTVTKSTDTTNGLDGTWSAFTTIPSQRTSMVPIAIQCRTDIVPAAATGVRGLKFYYGFTTQARSIHVYGQIPLTENPDRLVLCDPAGTVVTDGAYFDFGDSPRATTATKTFRIGNNSATKTANSIAMSFEELYDASPTMVGQFQYNFGAGWVTTGTIGHIGPGALSNVIQVRRNTSASAAAGPWQSRVVAVPASMT